jgi:hypothetical protein
MTVLVQTLATGVALAGLYAIFAIGLSLGAYLTSKLLVLGMITAVQAAGFTVLALLGHRPPDGPVVDLAHGEPTRGSLFLPHEIPLATSNPHRTGEETTMRIATRFWLTQEARQCQTRA